MSNDLHLCPNCDHAFYAADEAANIEDHNLGIKEQRLRAKMEFEAGMSAATKEAVNKMRLDKLQDR